MTEHPRICQACGGVGDWRGLAQHHIIAKKMGGRKGEARKMIEAEENKIWLCGRCHAKMHHIREK